MKAAQPDALSSASLHARDLYDKLLFALQPFGMFQKEVKKTSIHLVRSSAFAGVHPRKLYLLLTIKSARPIKDPRVFKTEQVSKNRWHVEVRITTAKEIDTELLAWLREAYDLCA